jgi:hypothetical protein
MNVHPHLFDRQKPLILGPVTLSPEPGALLCCANLPGDWALYAVSVRPLTALRSELPLPAVALACGSPFAWLKSFGLVLAAPPLPSASVYVMSHDITGFTYRGLSPHKFTPMPGVHNLLQGIFTGYAR